MGADSSSTLQTASPLPVQQSDPADGEQGAATTEIAVPQVHWALGSPANTLFNGPVIAGIALPLCNSAASVRAPKHLPMLPLAGENDCLLVMTRKVCT